MSQGVSTYKLMHGSLQDSHQGPSESSYLSSLERLPFYHEGDAFPSGGVLPPSGRVLCTGCFELLDSPSPVNKK